MAKIEVIDETIEEEVKEEKPVYLDDSKVTHSIVIDLDTRSKKWISKIYSNEEKILQEENEDVPKLTIQGLSEYFLSVIQYLSTSPDVDKEGNLTTKREKEFDEFLKKVTEKNLKK